MTSPQPFNQSYESFINKTVDTSPLQVITGQTATNPVVLTVAGHGIRTGRVITISGNTTSTPLFNGDFVATVIDEDTFSILVDVTVAGSDGRLQTEQGTSTQPRHVTYYLKKKQSLSAISLASPAIITTATPHNLTTGQYVFMQDTTSTPSLDGGRFILVITSTTFSVGVDTTVAGVIIPGTTDTGYFYDEQFLKKDFFIDGYDSNSDPVLLGNSVRNTRYNISDGNFESILTGILQTIDLFGPNATLLANFQSASVPGYNPDVKTVFEDLNESTNTNWIPPPTSGTLSIVSTSALDTFGSTGLQIYFLEGLDGDFEPQTEVIEMTGTTPFVSSSLWCALNNVTAILFGSGGEAAGDITITNTDDAVIWSVFKSGATNNWNGVFTIREGYSLILKSINISCGAGGDFLFEIVGNPFGVSFQRVAFLLAHEVTADIPLTAPARITSRSTIKLRVKRGSGGGGNKTVVANVLAYLVRDDYFDSLI